jgi:hypothetical protein
VTYKKWHMRPFCHFLYLRYLVRECPKTKKAAQKFFISKINLKLVADIVFDLRNEYKVNRMKFGILGTKSFQRQF